MDFQNISKSIANFFKFLLFFYFNIYVSLAKVIYLKINISRYNGESRISP